ncbi:hypothetical protein [Herminiimonas contaminans]|uniref:Uncharacterized protein n=1 Tax=Herminiimonas contaminans TaxID=1111140 RepID=A0ABS0ER04_9BURK|nr:hypothetical protein [Herminiimonas contaminans]MBF8177221.1 hypothetical protein [Herminiimonas contaminans]
MKTTRTMSEISRNQFGFPPLSPLELARQTASAARLRISQTCNCKHCQQQEKLASVQNIVNNWSKKQ